MKKLTSVALAGILAASTMAVATTSADAGRKYYGPQHHGYHHPGRNNGGAAAAGAIFGFVAGAIASQAFAPSPYYYPPAPAYIPPPPPRYYPPVTYQPVYPAYQSAHISWCGQRYRSYNPATNTWVDFNGNIRVCVSPY